MIHILISVKKLLLAVILLFLLSSSVLAQETGTTLGNWVKNLPRDVAVTVGCDYRPPYSTYCWRHIVHGNVIVGTWHYKQDDERIISWYVPRRIL